MKESRNKKESGKAPPASSVDFGQLETLLEFMASHGLEELDYERAGLRIRLKKASTSASVAPALAVPVQASPVQSAPAVDLPGPARETASAPAPPAASEDLHVIKSPIVGTFYAAPSPGASAFVKIGDVIQAGQVVCIIEAMKLMNEIEADVSGEIVRALIENGQPVEYGQGLFAVRPSKKK
jgi:acetyl-CoA carboxylase biotin carboxyl carrier protein